MRGTITSRGRRAGIAGSLAAAAAVLLGALLPAAPAAAIPPGGPGSDTPGTSSSVSPATLEPCQTIGFTVSGYPAGETVYIKIDDGVGYGDTSIQGSGVWHMQAIPASGTVNGSFALPCDIAPGAHWLRYLASQYVDPSNPGAGTIGYTNRGGSDFTVVAAGGGSSGGSGGGSSGGSGGGRSSSGLGGAAPAEGTTVGSGAEQVGGQGGTLSIDPNAVETPEPTASPAASATATPVPTPSGTLDAAAASDSRAGGVPVVGIVVAAVLLVAGALTAWLLLRRRGPGSGSAADSGSGPADPGSAPAIPR